MLVKVVAVLVYIYAGEIRMEQLPAVDAESCIQKGQARIEVLLKDPKFDEGLWAGCVPVMLQGAENK